MDKVLSKTFYILRMPLALLVVYIHIDSLPIGICSYSGDGAIYNLIKIIVLQIANLAVPCFFIMSGYLLMYKEQKYLTILKKRFKSLFIPYIIWNLIAVFYIYLTQDTIPNSFSEIFISPANFPLWFLRDLILLTILFPLIRLIIEKLKYISLIIFIVLYITNLWNIPHYENSAIFFFSFGSYCGIKHFNFSLSRKIFIPLIIISIAVYFLSILDYDLYNINLMQRSWLLIGSTCTFTLAHKLANTISDNNILIKMSSSSYFVYLSHKIGPTYIAKMPFHFLPQTYSVATIRFIIAPIITILICYLLYSLGNKYIHHIFSFITGGK